jgi:penicillin-binding protein A
MIDFIETFFRKITLARISWSRYLVIFFIAMSFLANSEPKKNVGSSSSNKKIYVENHKPSRYVSPPTPKTSTRIKARAKVANSTTATKRKSPGLKKQTVAPSSAVVLSDLEYQNSVTTTASINSGRLSNNASSSRLLGESPSFEAPLARMSEDPEVISDTTILDNSVIQNYKVGYQYLDHVGPFVKQEGEKYFEVSSAGDKMYLSLDPRLQRFAVDLLAKQKVPWGAIVAIEPSTGRVRTLAGHSEVSPSQGQGLVSRSTFPAASLFKIITAAAAVETSGVTADTSVHYRGGTYTLNKHNYLPNHKSDKVTMKLSTALAKSCNPAFARVALNNLSVDILTQYASNFGFAKNLSVDFPVTPSTLSLNQDKYAFARTAAGFGDAFISPVHAASIAAALGNKGLMMRPYIVDTVLDRTGLIRVHKGAQVQDQIVLESTAEEVIKMMEGTTTEGTGKRQFGSSSPNLRKIAIASKTGTLSGSNPKGRYYWFVAVAPIDNPTLAIASLVIDNGSSRVNGVALGRLFYEYYFQLENYLTSSSLDNSRIPSRTEIKKRG